MENIADRLLEEHAALRRSLKEMMELLGRPQGVGVEDQASLNMPRIKEAQTRFSALLKAHEEAENRALPPVIEKAKAGGKLIRHSLEDDHRAVNEIFQLLASVTKACDGKNAYPLRSVMSLVVSKLERHLSYEEKELFPLLKDPSTTLPRV